MLLMAGIPAMTLSLSPCLHQSGMPSMAQSVERWACHSGGLDSIPAKVTGLATDVQLRGVHTRDDLGG